MHILGYITKSMKKYLGYKGLGFINKITTCPKTQSEIVVKVVKADFI